MIDPDVNVEAFDHAVVITAGEALVDNDAVYVDPADGKAYKCDADDLSKIAFLGFAQKSVAANATAYIRVDGHKGGFSGLTVNAPVYLSTTAGGVTSTAPANYKKIGMAVSATVIKISHDLTKRVRTYTADGTWTKPAGLSHIEVEVLGAGASGADGATNVTGASGGAGGYGRKVMMADQLASTVTVTVGIGGAGSTSSTHNDGGSSSFGAHVVATGGNDMSGGTCTGGDINIPGGNGGDSYGMSGSSGGSRYGTGGHSMYGRGGYNGAGANGYGSGGGGSENSTSGAGQDGIVIVTEYY